MKFRYLTAAIFIMTISPSLTMAANISNAISGVGPKDARITPYLCIQNSSGQVTLALAPGATADGNKYSGNPNYVSGALRFGGCSAANSYLGYLGLSVDANKKIYRIQSYEPPKGIHVTYANSGITSQGQLTGKIQYTQIQPNFNLLSGAPKQNQTWNFVGVNLSGLEFSKVVDPVVIPNLSEVDVSGDFSDLHDTQAMLNAGINTIRIPVSWGYLQLDGPGLGKINQEYYDAYLKPLLETLTSARIYTIVDLHAYMRYSIFGKEYSGCGGEGQCPDGTLILDAAAYQDIWIMLYTLMKNDNKIDINYIMLDLVNEPVGVPDDLVFTIQAAVIKSLRAQGYQGNILIEGNAWSGLHSWSTTQWRSRNGTTYYSNASLFTRENFAKVGITDLTNIIINVHQYLDSDYSGTQDTCLTDLSTQGPNGFNLSAFTNYLRENRMRAIVTEFGTGRNSTSCSAPLAQFMNYLKDNSATNKDYGFVGWTIWSTGHGWGNYNLRVTPTSYQMDVLRAYL